MQPPIADYGFLSGGGSTALVSRDGSIDWCCLGRFDAAPVFGRLLDWKRGGHFRVAPTVPYEADRRYLPGTYILETLYRTGAGVLVLTDCLPVPRGEGKARSGRSDRLVRRLHCEAGSVPFRVEFVPRFDYGLTVPRISPESDRLATAGGGGRALLFQSDVPITAGEASSCRYEASLGAGESVRLAVTFVELHPADRKTVSGEELDRQMEEARAFWREWSARCLYRGPHRDAVLRSALVLKGLSSFETGGIVAAPTTSLPEEVGGIRNWDYRYVWLRDAALSLSALFELGYGGEARAFGEFVWRTTAGRAGDLQIMYGIGGERRLPEVELEGLDGYRGSPPCTPTDTSR